jgi:hypothetical protein
MSDGSIRGGTDAGEARVPDDVAVVDRIVDGRHAVLLVGEAEVELHVDVTLLPEGTAEGDWLRIGFTVDADRTAQRRSDIEDRMERIRRTRGGGRFG